MKLLIVAGGGGHFSAALAVIEALPKDVQILVVGRKYAFEGDTALSLEYQTTKRLGIPFATLESGRLQRKLTKQTISSIGKIPGGLNSALQILRGFRPDVVISFGGYVALPIVLAASGMRIPIVLHEQTFGAGLANKISSQFAKKICLSWHESEAYFPKRKTVLTGNPVKKEILSVGKISRSEARATIFSQFALTPSDLPLLYVTGGSGGSHAINETVRNGLEEILQSYVLIHQTGDSGIYRDFDELTRAVDQLPKSQQARYVLRKFLTVDEVAMTMHASDVVIGRSGVNTVTELAMLGKRSILVPLKTGQKNEQIKNARFLTDIGLGTILEQSELTPGSLLAHIEKVIHNTTTHGDDSALLQERIVKAPAAIISVINHVYQQTSTEKTGKRQ